MFVASMQPSLAGFAIAYVAGCGLVGAMAYYHVTQPTAVRAAARPERAIVRLTIFGTFAGPVYLPLTEVLVNAIGWRWALPPEREGERPGPGLVGVTGRLGPSGRPPLGAGLTCSSAPPPPTSC
jgi:hypothetical protein